MRAFVVKDVDVGCMAVGNKGFVGSFPGVANAGSLAIWNGGCMDGVGIVVIKNKDVVVSLAAWNGEVTCLVGV